MGSSELLKEQLTILVNTCDAYDDLWVPFFTLLKRYWDPEGIRILLNTESKDFSFDGLNIECVHSPGEKRYGQRMINALKQVNTTYTLLLLDDFFIRKPVDVDQIAKMIGWMQEDTQIACFNCDLNRVYAELEVNKYPGFRGIPCGNSYVLSLQAGLWRTDILEKYWKPDVSPWEWEEYTNVCTVRYPEEKFYCAIDANGLFLDYGHHVYGDKWGVFRGKWIIEDVGPLFEKEKINIDFTVRGIFDLSTKVKTDIKPADGWKGKFDRVTRCMGKREIPYYLLYCGYKKIMSLFGLTVEPDYFDYLRIKAQERFLKKHNKQ